MAARAVIAMGGHCVLDADEGRREGTEGRSDPPFPTRHVLAIFEYLLSLAWPPVFITTAIELTLLQQVLKRPQAARRAEIPTT
jgi:hypothetical protein